MSNFTIFPAIDLRFGQVVRLSQGDPARQKTYDQNPANTARKLLEEGARWLHVINLDGAFGDPSDTNLKALISILKVSKEFSAQVQFGGGLHNQDLIDSVISYGVDRIILGSLAVREPQILKMLLQKYQPDQLAVSLDGIDNQVMVSGWREPSNLGVFALAQLLKGYGLQWLIYTDIRRDGMQMGSDFESTVKLVHKTGLNVIASGGVSSLLEIETLKNHGVAGAIIGKSLYEGNINLNDLLKQAEKRTYPC